MLPALTYRKCTIPSFPAPTDTIGGTMTVKVRLFASYAESLGIAELSVDVGSGATVADVVKAIAALPGADRLPPSPLIAVNCTYATAKTGLSDGDEVAFIPPVAGG